MTSSLPARALASRRGTATVAALVLVVAGVLAVVLGVLVGGTAGATLALLVLVLGVQAVVLVALAVLWRRSGQQSAETRRTRQLVRRTERRVVRQGLRLANQGGRVEERLVEMRRLNVHHRVTMERRSEQLHLGTERQVAAILDLNRLVPLPTSVPPLGGFAASPDLLVLLVSTLLARRPRVVLECGSGSSTLYLALAIRQHDLDCRIVAMDHEEQYAEATRALLREHGVADVAEVRTAPLRPTGLAGHDALWYDQQALAGVDDIGMLVVDGPPGSGGHEARYPAVPLARHALAERCVIVLDDVFREDERATAERWAQELADFSLHVDANLQKQAAVLVRG